jgi:hypothetical protein
MRSRPRFVLAFLLSFLASLLLAELVARTYFAMQVGPRLLLYGTPWHRNTVPAPAPSQPTSVQEHNNTFGNYQMYKPGNQSGYSKGRERSFHFGNAH